MQNELQMKFLVNEATQRDIEVIRAELDENGLSASASAAVRYALRKTAKQLQSADAR